MAVPKRKTSKQRKHTRSAANSGVSVPSMAECPQCHEMKLNHRACGSCGYYDGVQVVTTKEKKN